MTDAKPDRQAGDEAGQLMNRVLQAERDAKQAVAECEQRAEEVLRAAQARAQRLVSRADQRITSIKMRCNHRIDSVVKAIEKQQQEPGAAAHPGQLGEQAINAVVAALAAELTGAGDGATDERGKGR
jgi:vacuolar-type H+-ATPase subunit H